MLSSAHQGAYKAGILYHDISPGNIVFIDVHINSLRVFSLIGICPNFWIFQNPDV